MQKRSELEEKFKWNLSDYFASETEWNGDFDYISKNVDSFKHFEGKLSEKNSIMKCLKLESEIGKKLEALYVWANLKCAEDATNSESEERLNKISSLATLLSVATSFIRVEISGNDDKFLKELAADPEFVDYSVYFTEIIRLKPYILTKREEEILEQTADFASGFSNVFNKFNDADLKFDKVKDSKGKKIELTHSNYSSLVESPDRVLRKNTIIAMNNAYQKFNNTLSANYVASVKKNCSYAKIRKFESAIKQSIFHENASIKVYDTLIYSVKKNLSIFHKYFNLKKKALGVDNYAICDNFATLSSSTSLKLTFLEAINVIKEACKPLGKDYVALIDKAVCEKWIDFGINEGKDSGAFSTGAYGKKPVVLLSYEKNTNSVFTLAHELGHAMHTYLSNKNQPFEKAGYEIFVAEVASNVNEMLLLKYLLNKAKEKEEKMFFFDQFMSGFRGSVLRQTMFAEFEEFAHSQHERNLPMSADVLNKKYMDLNKEYFGKDVELLDEIAFEWSRIPHFYNQFYVYKYATGLICAITLAKQLLEGKDYVQKSYLNFLRSGCTLPPIELLKNAGANLEKTETFDEAFNFASDILREWENL